MFTRRKLLHGLAATSLLLAPGAVHAQGQTPIVPRDRLDTTRPVQGDGIRVCVDTLAPAREFDRAVAGAIADALLLKPTYSDAPSGFPLDGLGFFEELEIAMNNDCDMLPGMALIPNATFPEWATMSRAYATIPYVLVVADPAFTKLSDIPFDRRIGTPLGSTGDQVLVSYMAAQPSDRRWRRLGYADPVKMLERLKDGTLGGIILWQPQLVQVTGGDPAASGVRVIPADVLPAMEVSVGALVSSRDTFLRASVDTAIGALIADGTVARLLAEHGYAGIAGP